MLIRKIKNHKGEIQLFFVKNEEDFEYYYDCEYNKDDPFEIIQEISIPYDYSNDSVMNPTAFVEFVEHIMNNSYWMGDEARRTVFENSIDKVDLKDYNLVKY